MNWIEKIRAKSRAEKIKLIWRITAAAALLLVLIWILIGRYGNGAKGYTSLFQTLGNGFKNFKLHPPSNTPPTIPN